MISDSERFVNETKRDDLKDSIDWLYSQDHITKVLFKRSLMSLVETNLDEDNRTREEIWREKRDYFYEVLVDQLRLEKMLGLASEGLDEKKFVEVFNKVTDKYDSDIVRSVILDLIVDTYPKNLLDEKKDYVAPSAKQIAYYLIDQGKKAIELFFWEKNECYRLFTDEERDEIRSWIETEKN